MIKLVKMECPGCGALLKKKGLRTYKCSYCNAQYLLDMDVIVPVPDKKEATNKEKKKSVKSSGPKRSVANATKTMLHREKIILVLTVCLIALLCMMLGYIIPSANKSTKNQTGKGNGGKAVSAQTTNTRKIKSDFMEEFVAKVYGKEASELTEEEFGKLTHFMMQDSYHTVDYKLEGGEVQTVTISSEKNVNYQDLCCFPNLSVLHIQAYHSEVTMLSAFPKLEELRCNFTPIEVEENLSNPKNLKKLHCKYYEDGKGIGEIEKLENLTDLSFIIHISSAKKLPYPDLSAIAKLTHLESFYLDADDYMTLPFLSQMPWLREIDLHVDNLRDIRFLESIPKLEALTLVSCDIISVEELKNVPELKVLRLENCYQIDSYEPVVHLTQLEELMLSYYYTQELPESFRALKKVTTLTLEGFNDITLLKDFPNVTHLRLYGCNYYHFGEVECMKNLEELKLGAGHSLMSLQVLTKLDKLRKVDFESLNTDADAETLFMIPNLEELNLNNTELKIDLNLVQTNTSLKVLYLENLEWEAFNTEEGIREYNYENWKDLPMKDCIRFVTNFPNLEVLDIRGNQIDHLDFAKELKKLQRLDLTNNYISDLQPLKDLENLEWVGCGENLLTSTETLQNQAVVDRTTATVKKSPFNHYGW